MEGLLNGQVMVRSSVSACQQDMDMDIFSIVKDTAVFKSARGNGGFEKTPHSS